MPIVIDMKQSYRVLRIVRGTTVDGPGFRTSIYLAGCNHRCPGCHNPQSWDPTGGEAMSLKEILEITEEEDFDVTLTGGDPLFSPRSTQMLISALKQQGRNVWVYTGYTYEEILDSPLLAAAISEADTIVDGPFVESLKDSDLLFRGSSNQRIIHLHPTPQT